MTNFIPDLRERELFIPRSGGKREFPLTPGTKLYLALSHIMNNNKTIE